MHPPFGDKENGLELKLTFDGEMLNGEMFLPIVGQALVEGTILFWGDVLRAPRPDGLGLVKFLVFNSEFLDLLRLLRLVLIINLFNLRLLFLILLDLFVVVFDLLKIWLAHRCRTLHVLPPFQLPS